MKQKGRLADRRDAAQEIKAGTNIVDHVVQLVEPGPQLLVLFRLLITGSDVIQKALQKILGSGYQIIDETGRDLPYLIKTYVDRDIPVILWATIDLRDIIVGPCWKLKESGEDFTWLSNEHCMLLVGYDETHYIFNDPWNNNGVISYEKKLLEDRFKKQHSQALGVIKK